MPTIKHMRQKYKRLLIFLGILGGAFAFPFLWRGWVEWRYTQEIYTIDEVPEEQVAIVYGAAVRNGRLTTILRDRMDTAIALYEVGKVQQIIVSGSYNNAYYNEPEAMMAYAIQQGIPAEDIYPDYGGWRTYDTCYRAKHTFGVDQAILVTQAFHLPRAIFTCRALGIEAVGVTADVRTYRGEDWYAVREFGATLQALVDVIKRDPAPYMDEDSPTPIAERET